MLTAFWFFFGSNATVAARLLQDPRFYKFHLYTEHKKNSTPQIGASKTAGPGTAAPPISGTSSICGTDVCLQ